MISVAFLNENARTAESWPARAHPHNSTHTTARAAMPPTKHAVIALTFGLRPPQDVRDAASVQVTSSALMHQRIPDPAGPVSLGFGAATSFPCQTCGRATAPRAGVDRCRGHTGYFEPHTCVVAPAVIGPLLAHTVTALCSKCFHVVVRVPADVRQLLPPERLLAVSELARRAAASGAACAHCGAPEAAMRHVFVPKAPGSDAFGLQAPDAPAPLFGELSSYRIMLAAVPDDQLRLLGFNVALSRPADAIQVALPMAGIHHRIPNVEHEGSAVPRHALLSTAYGQLVALSQTIRDAPDDAAMRAADAQFQDAYAALCSGGQVNNGAGSHGGGGGNRRQAAGWLVRLRGKKGAIRGNIGHKGLPTIRAVLNTHSACGSGEIWLPRAHAQRLRRTVRVTNMAVVRALICLMRQGVPMTVADGDGALFVLDASTIDMLRVGTTVSRGLIDGDMVIAGRNPSIHPLSVGAYAVRLTNSGHTIFLGEANLEKKNADIDGDEVWAAVVDDVRAIAELQNMTPEANPSDMNGRLRVRPIRWTELCWLTSPSFPAVPVGDAMQLLFVCGVVVDRDAISRRSDPADGRVSGAALYALILPRGFCMRASGVALGPDGAVAAPLTEGLSKDQQNAVAAHVLVQCGPKAYLDWVDAATRLAVASAQVAPFGFDALSFRVAPAARAAMRERVAETNAACASIMERAQVLIDRGNHRAEYARVEEAVQRVSGALTGYCCSEAEKGFADHPTTRLAMSIGGSGPYATIYGTNGQQFDGAQRPYAHAPLPHFGARSCFVARGGCGTEPLSAAQPLFEYETLSVCALSAVQRGKEGVPKVAVCSRKVQHAVAPVVVLADGTIGMRANGQACAQPMSPVFGGHGLDLQHAVTAPLPISAPALRRLAAERPAYYALAVAPHLEELARVRKGALIPLSQSAFPSVVVPLRASDMLGFGVARAAEAAHEHQRAGPEEAAELVDAACAAFAAAFGADRTAAWRAHLRLCGFALELPRAAHAACVAFAVCRAHACTLEAGTPQGARSGFSTAPILQMSFNTFHNGGAAGNHSDMGTIIQLLQGTHGDAHVVCALGQRASRAEAEAFALRLPELALRSVVAPTAFDVLRVDPFAADDAAVDALSAAFLRPGFSLSPFFVRFAVCRDRALARATLPSELGAALQRTLSLTAIVDWSEHEDDEWVVRVFPCEENGTRASATALAHSCMDAVLRGVPHLCTARVESLQAVDPVSGEEEQTLVVRAHGGKKLKPAQLMRMLTEDLFDPSRLLYIEPPSLACAAFGAVAAARMLRTALHVIPQRHGVAIPPDHARLLADVFTHGGSVQGCTVRGTSNRSGPIASALVERPAPQMLQAAFFGAKQDTSAPHFNHLIGAMPQEDFELMVSSKMKRRIEAKVRETQAIVVTAAWDDAANSWGASTPFPAAPFSWTCLDDEAPHQPLRFSAI